MPTTVLEINDRLPLPATLIEGPGRVTGLAMLRLPAADASHEQFTLADGVPSPSRQLVLWCSAPGCESYPLGRSRLGVPLPFFAGLALIAFPRGAAVSLTIESVNPPTETTIPPRPSIRRRRVLASGSQSRIGAP